MNLDPEAAEILYGPIETRAIEWIFRVPNQLNGTNLSFSEPFLVDMIRLQRKECTVRPVSPYRERIGEGTVLHLFYKLRQPECVKIMDVICTGRSKPLRLSDFTEELAWADGFRPSGKQSALDNMRLWFIQQYHLKHGAGGMEFLVIGWGGKLRQRVLEAWCKCD